MNETAIDIELFPLRKGSEYRDKLPEDVSQLPKVPAPIYRHAAPSAPWPWMDFDADVSEVSLPPGQDPEWCRYPQSLFANWTYDQVARCGILKEVPRLEDTCSVHKVDVFNDGAFDRTEDDRTFKVDTPRAYWNHLQTCPPSDVRVRALFVENMTVPILQILGTKYNVEPFFFASSTNWIPSRYQEDPKDDEDHITVVLPFIRVMKYQEPIRRSKTVRTASFPTDPDRVPKEEYNEGKHDIDTQAPLPFPSRKFLLQDLLALHMHRNTKTSTIISYHPASKLQRTSARRLQSLVQRTGDSVYWSKIYKRSKDPTFLFLAILWYALYAWDEAFEALHRYINALEAESKPDVTAHVQYTQKLHQLQAHILYYQQLLCDFTKSVEFVKNTRNPAMNSIAPLEKESSEALLKEEADHLLSEIQRLERQRAIQSERLQNAMHLAFSIINIQDSKVLQRDSAAMKQISYLTMIFLPASYLASVFGMNVVEINPGSLESLGRYIVSTIALTAFTAWVVITLQEYSSFHQDTNGKMRCGIVQRVAWPYFNIRILILKLVDRDRCQAPLGDGIV